MSFRVSRKRALRSLSAIGLSPNLEVKDVRQPDFLRKVPVAADGARAITIAPRAKSAAAGIPPAAAELAVIEVDRDSQRRVIKRALRMSPIAERLRQACFPATL